MTSTLGLEPSKVRVAPYSLEWHDVFEAERSKLADALGSLAVHIEHVGSTAVPGMSAKPIIDIAIAIERSESAARISKILDEVGYKFAVDARSEGGLIFYREINPRLRTHHVHVISIDDPQWRNYLRFRDLLRKDASVRRAYTALKERLAREFADDRDSYTMGKSDFVRAALESRHDDSH